MKIRVSYGTALELGLENGDMEEKPTTAYLLVHGEGKCRGGCTYCTQAGDDSRWLSRVSWPLYDLDRVKERLKTSDFERICVQSPDTPDYVQRIKKLVEELKSTKKPISLSAPPIDKKDLEALKDPIDRVGVGLDAPTDELRKKKKPSYEPKVFWKYLGDAVDVYGEGKVTAHLIVGLGENFDELATAVKKIDEVGGDVSLFPYTNGSDDVELSYYRRAQLVTYLITDGLSVKRAMSLISEDPSKALGMVDEEKVFQTRGCPGCNRPYYTTSPGSEHRNYPRKPLPEELKSIRKTILGDDS